MRICRSGCAFFGRNRAKKLLWREQKNRERNCETEKVSWGQNVKTNAARISSHYASIGVPSINIRERKTFHGAQKGLFPTLKKVRFGKSIPNLYKVPFFRESVTNSNCMLILPRNGAIFAVDFESFSRPRKYSEEKQISSERACRSRKS